MHKLKICFHYHKSLMSFNLPFSLLAGVVSSAISEHRLIGLINGFSLSLLTGSFVLSLYFYEQRNQNQYYFYHNMGIGKASLIVSSCLFNVALVVLLFFLKLYLYA